MNDDGRGSRPASGGARRQEAQDPRGRLAEALRANLARRKAQSRERQRLAQAVEAQDDAQPSGPTPGSV